MSDKSGWEGYVHLMQHNWHKKKEQFTTCNICSHAAIYGKDGTPWAVSADWPGLLEYTHEQEQEDGTTLPIKVNEFQMVWQAAGGVRKPSEAGIRLNNQKYVFVNHDQEEKSTQLSRVGGGGAHIARLKEAVLIGIWEKDVKQSDGKDQSNGMASLRVDTVSGILKGAGF